MSLEGKSVEEIQALAELAERMNADPRTRSTFLQAAKTLNPTASIPEIDIPASLQQRFAEPLKQLGALTKKAQEREIQDQINARRQEIMAAGVSAEEVPKVEKLMVDKGIANHATAVEFMRAQERNSQPTAASVGQGIRRLERPTIDMKAIGGDLKGWSYQQANAMIDEMRGRAPARH